MLALFCQLSTAKSNRILMVPFLYDRIFAFVSHLDSLLVSVGEIFSSRAGYFALALGGAD